MSIWVLGMWGGGGGIHLSIHIYIYTYDILNPELFISEDRIYYVLDLQLHPTYSRTQKGR